MENLIKITFFIFSFTLVLMCLLIGSDGSVIAPYEPYQSVRPTTREDTESYYYDYFKMYMDRPITKPYMLVTASSEVGYSYSDPNFKVIDYGTYHEIDSLKCVRYKQMQWRMYHLDKLSKKSCE